jgi:hypothetical protein
MKLGEAMYHQAQKDEKRKAQVGKRKKGIISFLLTMYEDSPWIMGLKNWPLVGEVIHGRG